MRRSTLSYIFYTSFTRIEVGVAALLSVDVPDRIRIMDLSFGRQPMTGKA